VNCLCKAECARPGGPFDTLEHIQAATADWARSYNEERLHSSLGHCPSAEVEAAFAAHRAGFDGLRARGGILEPWMWTLRTVPCSRRWGGSRSLPFGVYGRGS
jgi:hypothetical protein